MQEKLPQRKYPAHPLPVRRHNDPVIVFLTVCSTQRQRIFDNSKVHEALKSIWMAKNNHWVVGYYLLMPDHIHLFCAPGSWETRSVSKWAGYWKRQASLQCPHLKSKWLADGWDTQIRSLEMFRKKLEYVRENPVRAKLVENSKSWPHQGTIRDLAWLS